MVRWISTCQASIGFPSHSRSFNPIKCLHGHSLGRYAYRIIDDRQFANGCSWLNFSLEQPVGFNSHFFNGIIQIIASSGQKFWCKLSIGMNGFVMKLGIYLDFSYCWFKVSYLRGSQVLGSVRFWFPFVKRMWGDSRQSTATSFCQYQKFCGVGIFQNVLIQHRECFAKAITQRLCQRSHRGRALFCLFESVSFLWTRNKMSCPEGFAVFRRAMLLKSSSAGFIAGQKETKRIAFPWTIFW